MIRPRAIAGGLIAIAMIVVACGASPGTSPGPLETASIAAPASATPVAAAVTSPVDGVLTHIEAAGLSKVTGFTLRLATGREIRFRIGVLENGDQFPPGHLAEHLATSAPIRVWFRPVGPDLVVYRLEDAPAS
jgi:hypothetical protein